MTDIMQYNYSDILNKINKLNNDNNNDNFILSEYVENVLNELNKIITVQDDIFEPVTLKRSDRSFDRGNKQRYRRNKCMSRASSANDMTIEDWEAMRNFKPTEKVEKKGIDKHINELRCILNKISVTNYESQKVLIIEKIDDIFKEENNENNKLIGEVIFNTCSSNKFLSEVYSDLYVELVGYNDIFGDFLDNYIQNFRETLNNIKYIDADVDYDGFCDYNKTNEFRRANSTFLINLMNRDMITKQSILKLIIDIQNIINKFIDTENRLHEVNELTENIFILITMSKQILCDYDEWKNTIQININNFMKLKVKEHKSLSSRSIFKYMDM